MATTRQKVLETLLTHDVRTINDIADDVGINPISVRHHIARLEADGLVDSREERHGVGRPRRLYYLTENGREKFPTRYLRLTLRLLDQLKDTVPQSFIDMLFTQMAEELLVEYQDRLEDLSMEDRLELVTELLTDEGFIVEWEKRGDEYIIRESNCPYYYIGQDHPEICKVDQTLISTVLSVPVNKINCMLDGDAHCTYTVTELSPISVENRSAIENEQQ